MAAMTVLLAEDDENDVLLMQRAFQRSRKQDHLQVVRDGQEVIDYLAGRNQFSNRATHPLPNLVILDLKMPRKTGFEVLEWLKTQPTLKRIPAVVLTSSNQPKDITRAYDLHANSYLVKPNAFEDLVKLTENAQAYWLDMNRPGLH
jgi:CheY-like chemotaxis protein